MINKEYPLKNVATSAQCLAEAVDLCARKDLPIIMIDSGRSGGGEPKETHIGKYYVDSEGRVHAKAFAISPDCITNPEFGEFSTISLKEAKEVAEEFGIRHIDGSLLVFDSKGEEIENPSDAQILSAVSDLYYHQVPWQDGILVFCD